METMDWEINYKNITVKMSDGRVHMGKVNIRNFSRLSDFIKNKSDEFLILVPDEGDYEGEPLMLNKHYIIEVKEVLAQEMISADDTSVVNIIGRIRS
jgi:hypothetical protein